MNAKTGKFGVKNLILIGGVIFSMHFGGASMIWPMTWGQESGTSVLAAFIGIFLTALLVPLLGYIALSRGKGSFYQITQRVSPRFAAIFCGLTMLVLGPLFAIPRMSAAAWDAFVQISGFQTESLIPVFIFSIVYYLVVYWFIAQKSDTVDKMGKLLTPILLIAVAGILIKGLLFPLSKPVEKVFSQPAFAYGFVEGYATLELPCALIYATIIISDLKNKKLSGKQMNKALARAGMIGIGILTVTHLGHMIIGANTGELFADVKFAALYARVVVELWGTVGGVVFNIALLFAALTTAIGLAVATAEYFEKASHGKLNYRKSAIVVLAISVLVSTMGLSNIVVFVTPLLDVIYPAAITLTLYYALIPNLIKKTRLLGAMQAGVIGAFVWGTYEGIIKYMEMFHLDAGLLKSIYAYFPLSNYGLGWVLIVGLASIGGYFFANNYRAQQEQEVHVQRSA